MSALAALCRSGGSPVGPEEIGAMLDALDWWRPDARAQWTQGSAGLGHLLLHTTAASTHERLPLADEAASLAITGDIRLDNRDELRAKLGAPADTLAGSSDGALVLAAYRKWRHECVRQLRGDFAFAVWDGSSRELFCARDRFGVKPLYYAHHGGTLALATEMKGLLALPFVDRGIDEGWIAEYLHRISVDRTATFYRSIKRLAGSHALTFGERGLRVYRYWQPDPDAELRLRRDEDYVDLFREKLILAVRRRLDTPGVVGAELSGGIDSSAICAIAARELRGEGRDLHTFSQVRSPEIPEGPGFAPDFRWAVDRLLSHAAIDNAHFFPGDGGVIDALEWACAHADEPVAGFTAFYYHSMYLAARERGVAVMLSGFGGNNCVSDPAGARLEELLRGFQWAELRRELSCTARPVRTALALLGAQFKSTYSDVAVRRGHHWRAHRYRPSRADFARRMHMWRRTFTYHDRARPRGTLRERATLSLQSHLSKRLDAEARWSAGARFEFRYPLLDEELVTTYLALPSRFKFWRGTGRHVLREAMRGWLPDEIRLSSGPRGDGNPGNLARQRRDEEELKKRIAALAGRAGNPVLRYVDVRKLFEPPPIRGRVPRERHTEMLQVLMLERALSTAGCNGPRGISCGRTN